MESTEPAARRPLLLSIRPAHSDALFQQTKRVELRRIQPSMRAGDVMIVYEPAPTCAGDSLSSDSSLP